MTEPEISFNIRTSTLEEKLAALPGAPGVYLHKDSAGKVITNKLSICPRE